MNENNNSVIIPNSILTADRCELSDLSINIEGELPEDLQGHFFMVAPVGSVDSGGLPYPSADSIINGDGMIFRLDFNQGEKVNLKTQIVKPPDYYADQATREGSPYARYRFKNHGVTRFSLTLGLRNQLNTAFLPMPFSPDSQQRLLITYDAGRPYEIDTETLEAITPVGSNQEWTPQIQGLNFSFPPVLSSAHPVFDAYTKEMFTVNYGRSFENFLETIPLFFELEEIPEELEELTAAILGFSAANLLQVWLELNKEIFETINQEIVEILSSISGVKSEDFVYLIRWDGTGYLERWKLVLPNGSPVIIKQTLHQIGLSKDYIILMDTAFITGLEQIINHPFAKRKRLEETLREVLEKPANPDSVIYLVRRKDLKNGQHPALGEPEVKVTVKQLTIPLEAAHFLVDYENPDNQITIHISHICAWDVAEWIRTYDRSAYGENSPISERIYAMETNPMDISRLGRYVINGENGNLIQSKVISENPFTWGTGLYAYLDRLPSGLPPSRLENIYWSSLGVWPELMTKYSVELYENYKYRALPTTEVLNLAKEGVPSCLLRLNTTKMEIVDFYQLPRGYLINSIQFMPRQGANGESTNGYLLCTVFSPDRNEFWLFDGENLKQGAICKLSHASLNFGFTLHTTWLPTINPHQETYKIPVSSDYQPILDQKSDPMIQKLFEEKIYPQFSNS
ncbi:UNVERIFIED_CONTAM: lignostilbene-alpha,beta-dioxygenase [Euhalothece sp. KZN 001]